MALIGQIATRPLLHEDPAKAKAAIFELMGYRMYADEVVKFHQSEAPVRITSAPARTSKSMSTYAEVVATIMPTKPLTSSLTWLIGPTYDINKEWDYTWECLVENRERWGFTIEKARNNPKGGDRVIVIPWGPDAKGHLQRAVIRGLSSTNEQSLQGEEVTQAVLSEAAEHPEHIASKYLATRCWRLILPTTPKPQAAWIREMIEVGDKDRSLGIEHFTFPRHANPMYNEERFEREKKKAQTRSRTGRAEDDPYFAEQFLGHWVYYTGLVLPFDQNRHVLETVPEEVQFARKFLSVDYGYEHASVALFWAVTSAGLVVFDEIHSKRLSTPMFVKAIEDKIAANKLHLDYVTGDPSRPEVERIMRDAGLPVFQMDKNAQRDRAAGQRRLSDMMTQGPVPGFPGIWFTKNCERTIAELKHLRFREGVKDEFGKAAYEGDDDCYDALRYGVMTRPRPPAEQEERDWLRDHQKKVASRRPKWGAAPRRELGVRLVHRLDSHAR